MNVKISTLLFEIIMIGKHKDKKRVSITQENNFGRYKYR